MRKLTLLTLIGCVVVAVLAFTVIRRVRSPSNGAERKRLEAYEYKNGRSEAELDWSHGTPRWITYGGPAFDRRLGDELLRRQLGLSRDHIADCVVAPGVERYTRDYNRVIWLKLSSLYGEEFVRRELRAAEVFPWDFETEANQSLEPTPTAGTSAAEQPLVPAAVVAHL